MGLVLEPEGEGIVLVLELEGEGTVLVLEPEDNGMVLEPEGLKVHLALVLELERKAEQMCIPWEAVAEKSAVLLLWTQTAGILQAEPLFPGYGDGRKNRRWQQRWRRLLYRR